MQGADDDLRVLNAKIEKFRALSPHFPRPHPSRRWLIAGLGLALHCRYLISSQEDDLLAAISLLTESLLFPFSPGAARVLPTICLFHSLACSLDSRFQPHLNPQDLKQAVRYYRHILTLPPWAINSLQLLEDLTRLLTKRVFPREKGSEVESDLAEEIVRILQRSAARDPSSEYLKPIAQNICDSLATWVIHSNRIAECEQILGLFTKVEELCPPELSLEFYMTQGMTFATCFQRTGLYDYSE
ncbi:hypothetical protein BC827DRAFT_164334 [Russula dissimulans]|nr:hypothetical protein BC827DRAFT_164334 [Russula dissimulans]